MDIQSGALDLGNRRGNTTLLVGNTLTLRSRDMQLSWFLAGGPNSLESVAA